MDELETLRVALASAVVLLTTRGGANHRDHWHPTVLRLLERYPDEMVLEEAIDAGVQSITRALAN